MEDLADTHQTARKVPALTRFVCGIDGSPEGDQAARVAATLAGQDGYLLLLYAVAPGLASLVPTVFPGEPRSPEDLSPASATQVLQRARDAVSEDTRVVTKTCTGPPSAMLEAEAVRTAAHAIAVGSHGNGRAAGVLLGSVATRLIHRAPCSVLVGRMPVAPETDRPFPRSVAVGIDGSPWSLAAVQAARVLSTRLGVPLRALHVADGSGSGAPLPEDFDDGVEEIHQHVAPANGLCSRVTESDLLVVGSRGVHGIRALGSVSEAVAHRSPASVLIVRSSEPGARGAR